MSVYKRLQQEKNIIGFCGKKRSGKDTAAKAVEDWGYQPIAFADPIKDSCQLIFEFTDEQIYGSLKSETDSFWGFSPRWAMQTVGTELFREGIDKDVWVKSLLARIDASDHDKFAVTDIRFSNEVEHLQRAGADIFYIERPKKMPDLNPTKKWFAKQGGLIKKTAELFTDFGREYHASEISLDDHPITDRADILNNGTIEQFKRAVRKRVERTKEDGGAFPSPDVPYRASDMKTG